MVNAFEKAFSLEGELALITGGGTGLGFAMAKCFVQAGARVVIAGRREDVLAEAVRELGPKAAYRVFDVTDTAHAVSFVEELSREMGPVTILVNNAGRHCKKPMLDVTQGVVHCAGCKQMGGLSLPLCSGALAALRHVLYGESKRLYSFRLDKPALNQLDHVSEAFIAAQLERGFRTLDYYKSIRTEH